MNHRPGVLTTRSLLGAVLSAILLASARPVPAQVVDTRSFPGAGIGLGLGFGQGVVGQSFTAPAVAPDATLLLQDFTFYFFRAHVRPDREATATPATFHAVLQAFDGTRATGPILYASLLQTGPAERTPLAVPYSFDVGGLMLTPGAQYFAYILDDGLPGNSHTAMSAAPAVDYAGGSPFRGSSPTALVPLRAPAPLGPFTDLPFVATFSTRTVTPEPATVALVGGGLLALGGIAARRRRER